MDAECKSPKPLAQRILYLRVSDSIGFRSFRHDPISTLSAVACHGPVLHPALLPCCLTPDLDSHPASVIADMQVCCRYEEATDILYVAHGGTHTNYTILDMTKTIGTELCHISSMATRNVRAHLALLSCPWQGCHWRWNRSWAVGMPTSYCLVCACHLLVQRTNPLQRLICKCLLQ